MTNKPMTNKPKSKPLDPGPWPKITPEATALVVFFLRAGVLEVTPAGDAFFRACELEQASREAAAKAAGR